MENNINKGEHLRFIRKYLGLTQKEFGELLGDWGINDKQGTKGKTPEVIASWESGRRNIPDKILKVIQKNVKYENQKIRWEYLIGNDDFKTSDSMKESIPLINAIREHYEEREYLPLLLERMGHDLSDHKLKFRKFEEYLLGSIDHAIKNSDLSFEDFMAEQTRNSIELYNILHTKG